MLKNYLHIAWRNLLKNRTSSIINITGLATGMAIALIIGLWIADELSFDHYHSNHSRLAKGMIIQHTTDGVDVQEVGHDAILPRRRPHAPRIRMCPRAPQTRALALRLVACIAFWSCV